MAPVCTIPLIVLRACTAAAGGKTDGWGKRRAGLGVRVCVWFGLQVGSGNIGAARLHGREELGAHRLVGHPRLEVLPLARREPVLDGTLLVDAPVLRDHGVDGQLLRDWADLPHARARWDTSEQRLAKVMAAAAALRSQTQQRPPFPFQSRARGAARTNSSAISSIAAEYSLEPAMPGSCGGPPRGNCCGPGGPVKPFGMLRGSSGGMACGVCAMPRGRLKSAVDTS
eukprot:7383798-Prymnesium_polylepis.1